MFSLAELNRALKTASSSNSAGGQRRRRRRRRRRAGGNPMGAIGSEVVITRSEMLVAPAKGASAGVMFLCPVNFPWLGTFSKAFDVWRTTRMRLEWRPAVATNTAGTIAYGIDWAAPQVKAENAEAPARTQVLALTPVMDGPVWRGSTLTLPQSILATRKWYTNPVSVPGTFTADYGPGGLVYHSSLDDAAGEFWLHYTVHFYGTRKA